MSGPAAIARTVTASSAPDTVRRVGRWCIYALVVFPVVDYALRRDPVHVIGVIWDKILLLVLLALAAIQYLSGRRPPRFAWQTAAVSFMLFGLGWMFAGIHHPLLAFQGYRIDVYYLIFALLLPFIIEPEEVPRYLYVGAVMAVLIGIHGVYQYIIKVPIPPGWVDATEHVRTRVFSVLQSPNELGAYMALMTPIVLGMCLYETHRVRRWLLGIGALFCCASLLFSGTRGAWVALLVSALLVAVVFERRLFFLLLVGVVVAFFLPPIHHRIENLLSPVYWMKSATQGGRLERWSTAFSTMSVNPLFGAGLGRYGGAVASNYLGGTYSDNYYAKTLGETGLIGLTLLFAMHVALIRDIVQRAVRPATGRTKWAMVGGLVGLVAVLVHNFMENVFEFGPMNASYFTYATLLLIWGVHVAQRRTEAPPHQPISDEEAHHVSQVAAMD